MVNPVDKDAPSRAAQASEASTTEVDPSSVAAARQQLVLRVVEGASFVTYPLPRTGTLVIGRSLGVDVQLRDPSISRQHAMLHIGTGAGAGATYPLIEDLDSNNGTRVAERRVKAGEQVQVRPGELVELGFGVMLMLQPGHASSRPVRMWTQDGFADKLAEQCAAGAAPGFALARLCIDDPIEPRYFEELLALNLRPQDIAACLAPGEFELLVADSSPIQAEGLIVRIAKQLESHGIATRSGIACYPRDGRTPAALAQALTREPCGGERPGSAVVIEDPAMRRLYELLDRMAVGSISVLLLGETGVGKEVVAAALHQRSGRRDQPMLKLNCAALSPALLESELFGHEKGAFTGAAQTKPGLLETAHGGTVFLDEVGELPLAVQVKLLRVIEEREVLRVGALKPRPIDVRFIAATHRDLEAEIAKGAFRQDLYFRLNGSTLVIPPLRERPSEIASLARAVASQVAKAAHRSPTPRLSLAALSALKGYAWPGNIRELRNVIERAVLLCAGDEIQLEHLPMERMQRAVSTELVTLTQPVVVPPPAAVPAAAAPVTGLRSEIEAIEKQRILDALAQCAGNQSSAAKLLGISRGTLQSRLEAYGVPRPRKGPR